MSNNTELIESTCHDDGVQGEDAKRGFSVLKRMPLWARSVLITLAVVCLVIVVAVGADSAFSYGRIHPGISVGEVSVGGMTVTEAAEAIDEFVAERTENPLTVLANGAVWEVSATDIGLSVDSMSLASDAYSLGRGTFDSVVLERLQAVLKGYTLPLSVSCDKDAMSLFILDINTVVATPAINAGIIVEGESVRRTDPVDGLGVDEETARDAILQAFLSDEDTLELDLVTLAPMIDTKNAQGAYETACAMVSGPVVLYYEDQEWEVSAETIGGWIAFRNVEMSSTPVLEAYISAAEVSATVLPMVAEVGRPATDASFSVSSGNVTIVPGESGLATDAEDLATRLTTLLGSSGNRRAELTMKMVEPTVTTKDAEAMGIVECLGTFTTEYSSGNLPRVHNIHLLADTLNGTLVAPGETCSFNETVGERTAVKGYQAANAIVNGELVPQIGGGICQVGTTIFNTVFFSGLPITERHNHSLYISHYPKGRDATISWNGPDFKFVNDTDHYILIATSYTNSSVTVAIYGTNPGYTVTYDTGPWTNIIQPAVKEIEDDTLPVGAKVVETTGQSGRTIIVTRHVLLNGVEICTDTFKSVYRATEEVVRVGTMVEEEESSTATSTP